MNRKPMFLLVILLLAGCATTQSPTRAAKVDEAEVNRIYAALEAAVAKADAALSGEGDAAGSNPAQALTEAREALTAAAGRCVATAGCEIERVLAAQDALIVRQSQRLIGEGDGGATEGDAAPVAGDGEGGSSPLVAAMPEARRSMSLLKGKDLRSIIRLNEPTKAAIEEWLTWMRPNLIEAYENYQYMRHKMWPEYERAGLPEALLFGILAKESGGKVHAVSRAGASGPLQFMPHTGLRYGLNAHGGFDLRFDPAAATRANVAYLNDQFRALNDDLELALGAYNGGEGRMSRLSPGGRYGFWDSNVQSRLPPETRDYVPMVLAAAWLFLHPEEYRLEFPIVDATPARVTLAQSLSINELAVCLGQDGNPRGWFRTLRNLNPRYEANARIAPGTAIELPKAAVPAYEAHCRPGSPVLAKAMDLHQATPAVPPAMRLAAAQSWKQGGAAKGGSRSHVVRKGETLSSIARKYGCGNVRAIAQANRIKPPGYPIRAGQRLAVPSCGA